VICHLVEFPLYFDSPEDRFEQMVEGYKTIRAELKAYNIELAQKHEIVCWSKADILPKDELDQFSETFIEKFVTETGCPEPVMVISAVSGEGCRHLLGKLAKVLDIDLKGAESADSIPEYIDGEPPEEFLLSELSMERLEESEEDN